MKRYLYIVFKNHTFLYSNKTLQFSSYRWNLHNCVFMWHKKLMTVIFLCVLLSINDRKHLKLCDIVCFI